MAQENPYAKYVAKPANPYAGYVAIGDPDPTYQTKAPMAQAELQAAQARAAQAAAQAAADTRIKNAQADKIERDNRDASAADALTTMRRTSNVSGPAYLASLPADRRAIVSGLLQGNLPVGARGLTSPQMLPFIQDAINADPSFSANTFAARQKAVTELASAKATGGYLATTAAAIDHSREMEDAIRGLHQGNVVLNPQPGRQMANHLAARAELDAAQDAYRTAKATPGVNTGPSLNRVVRARQSLRDAEASLSGAPDPSQPANVPGYTTQTLDYVKRGFDDGLEQYRNPITGKLVLDEAGRAQNGVRQQFLSEVDRLNPAYADARAAYAGPASQRSNLAAGQQAYTANPQQLGVDLAGSSPERVGQMQLGYQGALVDHAGRVRDSANPWEATLGSPMARDRFATMFPDSPGLANFFRQRELESGMQQTSNAILGNSRTARNLAADQAFAGNPVADAAIHGTLAVATHGASIPGTAMRMGGSGLSDWLRVGRGVAKADALVPTLTQTDPASASATLQDILSRQQVYNDFVARTTPRRTLGMFGASGGSQLGLAALNYGGG